MESKLLRRLNISHLEKKVARLQAEGFNAEELADLKHQMQRSTPNPRDTFESFDEYLDGMNTAMRKMPGVADSFTLPETQVAEIRELWDNYDKILAAKLAEGSKAATEMMIQQLEKSLSELRSMG